MKWISLRLYIWSVLLLFGSLAQAGNTDEYMEFFLGARCLAMGGACVAVVNDETALAVNPAALGRLRDNYGTYFDPEVESNTRFMDFFRAGSLGTFTDLSAASGALAKNRSRTYRARTQFMPSFVGKNVGIGIMLQDQLTATLDAAGTSIDTNYRSDLALLLGYNLSFFDGIMKLGFNGKMINRIEVKNAAVSAAGSLAYKDIGSEGTGLSVDVGLILAAPIVFLPTLSAVVRDVGGTSFDKMDGMRLTTASRPETVNQDVDVGFALFPIHNNSVRSAWTVEYRGVLTASEEDDSSKRIHTGIELNIRDVFFVRTGYNQRYITGGIELASENFQWQITTYGEEIGNASDGPKEDRRTVFKFAWRF